MDWKQEVFKRIDALAEKLGTTAAYLWRVLVKQAYIDGFEFVALAVVGAMAICGGVWLIRRYFAKPIERETVRYGEKHMVCRSDDFAWMCVIGNVAWILGVVAVVCGVTAAAEHFLNPDFFALQLLRSALAGN